MTDVKITIKNYQDYAVRTMASMGRKEADLIHMCVGMCSEMNELEEALDKQDAVNISEECADILWYVSNYMLIMNWGFDEIFQNIAIVEVEDVPDNVIVGSLYHYISKLQDIDKKYFVYGKEPDENEVYDLIFFIANAVHKMFLNYGMDMEEHLDKNIKKLMKRFPNKFTFEDAINRDLKAEREILEGFVDTVEGMQRKNHPVAAVDISLKNPDEN